MVIHCHSVDELVISMKYPNTLVADESSSVKASGKKAQMVSTATYGTPHLCVRVKILGAFPLSARPISEREPERMPWFAEDQAEVRTTALMMCGRTEMPARVAAIVNGLLEAV